jgi:hypothetical protein
MNFVADGSFDRLQRREYLAGEPARPAFVGESSPADAACPGKVEAEPTAGELDGTAVQVFDPYPGGQAPCELVVVAMSRRNDDVGSARKRQIGGARAPAVAV